MKKILSLLYTLYFLVGAFIYIVVYGSIVLLIGFILRLFSKDLSRRFVVGQVETFGRMAFKLLGVQVHVYGKKPEIDQNYLVVANHQSALDIPLIIGYVAPVGFIAKKELGKIPGINWYLKYLGSVLIDRGNIRKTALALKEVIRKIQSGVHFIIFPEGTRSPDGSILPFKNRSLEISYKYGIKILPVSIWGAHEVLPKKSLVLHRKPVYLKIHDLVDPKNFNSEEELREYVRNIIVEGTKFLERRSLNEKSNS